MILKPYSVLLAIILPMFLSSCSNDDDLEEMDEQVQEINETEKADESFVQFNYIGDFQGAVNTTDITAQNLDGGDIDLAIDLAESGMMYVNLQESDFQVGEMMDIYQEDRNTLTLELGDYKLLLQPGSQLTVADRSDNGIHIKSGEMTFKGYQISDDMQERPTKMITLKGLDLQYYR